LLPYVLEACAPQTRDRLVAMAGALGVATGDEAADARAAVDRIEQIVREIGIPASLAELGIDAAQLPRIAELAAGVTRLAGNAARPADAAFLERILDAALAGDRARLRPQDS